MTGRTTRTGPIHVGSSGRAICGGSAIAFPVDAEPTCLACRRTLDRNARIRTER